VERQAGLGRSLGEVIESLTPAEPDVALTRGNDLHDITPQLYRLVVDVQDLRDRVDRLEAEGGAEKSPKPKNETQAKKKRNASAGKKTK
jgi:hypothetical protein